MAPPSSCRASDLHGQHVTVDEISQAWPGAPETAERPSAARTSRAPRPIAPFRPIPMQSPPQVIPPGRPAPTTYTHGPVQKKSGPRRALTRLRARLTAARRHQCSLSLSLTLFANAGASGVALDELYRHPVTQSDVQELLSSVALGGDVGPEELARLVFFAGIDLSPDGTAHVATGAEMTPAIDPDLRAVQEVVYFGAPNMGQVLSAAADLAPDAWMEVEIAVARSAFDDGTTADGALLLAAARGEVVTISDAYAVREKWIADREASTAPALDQLEEDIWILGGRVLSRFGLAGTLRAELPADAVAALEFTDNVQSVSAGESGSDDAGFAWYVDGGDVDGYELEDLLQSWQFTEYGLDGFVSAFEHTAVLEPNGDKILVGHQGSVTGPARPASRTAHTTRRCLRACVSSRLCRTHSLPPRRRMSIRPLSRPSLVAISPLGRTRSFLTRFSAECVPDWHEARWCRVTARHQCRTYHFRFCFSAFESPTCPSATPPIRFVAETIRIPRITTLFTKVVSQYSNPRATTDLLRQEIARWVAQGLH